jgi:hypothetical protein
MAHIPINHPLQPLYRTLAGLVGAYILAFGIVGVIRTRDVPTFEQDNLPYVLGLHANRAFAVLSIVAGAIVLIGAFIGGKLDERINLYGSGVFLVAGLAMLVVERTELNFLGFTPATSIVSFFIGMALLLAGLYGKVGTREDIEDEEAFRHGRGPDPQESHPLTTPNPPPAKHEREREREPGADAEHVSDGEQISDGEAGAGSRGVRRSPRRVAGR